MRQPYRRAASIGRQRDHAFPQDHPSDCIVPSPVNLLWSNTLSKTHHATRLAHEYETRGDAVVLPYYR